LTQQSKVFGFGDNSKKQIGLSAEQILKPTIIGKLIGFPIVQVAAGSGHSLVFTKAGGFLEVENAQKFSLK
jgi:alpha-tubulin suppressor-like RCC1 family protein